MHGGKIHVTFNSSVKTDERFEINLRMPNRLGFVEDVEVLFNRRGEEPGAEKRIFLTYSEENSNETYSSFIGETVFSQPGYRTFFIKLNLNGNYTELKCGKLYNEGIISNNGGNFWQMFVYLKDFETPDDMKGGIWYHIYVDTFCSEDLPENLNVESWDTFPKWKPDPDGIYRNNQRYGGNLKGIISKLDYLQALSVTVIFLSPIFKSEYQDGYSIDDYEAISKFIGSWDDLELLHKECKKRGMKLVLDIVPNHSGPNNPLIQKHPEMYKWKDAEKTIPECWWDYPHLRKFDTDSDVYYDYWEKWLRLYSHYCDGVRIDVMDELPDKVLEFIFKRTPFICGEVWKNGVNNNDGREYLTGNKTHALMNYQFGNMILRYVRFRNVENFLKVFQNVFTLYPPMALDVSPIFLTSHDTARLPNMMTNPLMKDAVENGVEYEKMCDIDKDPRWYDEKRNMDTLKFRTYEKGADSVPDEDKEKAFNLARDAIFLQYTSPGVPSVFAGDEVFMNGLIDPFNRKTFPWESYNMIVEKLIELVQKGTLKEYKSVFSNSEDYGEKMLEFYVQIGLFRMNYREIFSDSRNFEPIFCDKEVIMYKWKNLFIIKNWNDYAIENKYYSNGEIVFSYNESTKNPEIIPGGEAVVIKLKE